MGRGKPLLRSLCILYVSLFFRADTTTLYVMVVKWGSSVNDVLVCNTFYDFWVRGQFFPFSNMQGHQHLRTFQLPFQQLDLLHLVPSLPSSLQRGNRSNLRELFGEHLRSTEDKISTLDHTLSDAEIRGIKLCTGNNIRLKRLEMRLIFRLGTVQPRGMNINFSFN